MHKAATKPTIDIFLNTSFWCFYYQDNFINFYAPRHDYYAGIELDARTIVLCSKIRRHKLSNPKLYQFPLGLIAQLQEHWTGITEVMDSNPSQAWNFYVFMKDKNLHFLSF